MSWINWQNKINCHINTHLVDHVGSHETFSTKNALHDIAQQQLHQTQEKLFDERKFNAIADGNRDKNFIYFSGPYKSNFHRNQLIT